MIRLLGLGDNTVDTYVDAGLQYPGGNAVNVAVLARRLGAATAYIGCLADDAAGQLVAGALAAEGVDISQVRRVAGTNARALIRHCGGDRRFVGSRKGVRGAFALTEQDYDFIRSFDVLHTSIYSEQEDALADLRRSVRLLSFDYSERWSEPYLRRTLPLVDVAFLSWPGASDDDVAAILHSSAALGPSAVVITRGAAGACALAGGRLYRQPAMPADAVDTLGAGDGFIAAFLLAYADDVGVATALDRGAGFAAAVCSWPGAFGHGVPWDGEQTGIEIGAG